MGQIRKWLKQASQLAELPSDARSTARKLAHLQALPLNAIATETAAADLEAFLTFIRHGPSPFSSPPTRTNISLAHHLFIQTAADRLRRLSPPPVTDARPAAASLSTRTADARHPLASAHHRTSTPDDPETAAAALRQRRHRPVPRS